MNNSSIGLSVANSAFTEARSALVDFVTTNSNDILVILGLVVSLTLVFVAYRWIRPALRSFIRG